MVSLCMHAGHAQEGYRKRPWYVSWPAYAHMLCTVYYSMCIRLDCPRLSLVLDGVARETYKETGNRLARVVSRKEEATRLCGLRFLFSLASPC